MRTLVILLVLTRIAAADDDWKEERAMVEWSTWVRAGWGVASERPSAVARSTTQPPEASLTTRSQLGAGAEASLRIGSPVRLGAWAELRGDGAFAGGELVVTRSPGDLDLFWYNGEGIWIARAGASADHLTASLSWGYRCPWKLWGPYVPSTRYEIGVRLVLGVTRAMRDPSDWSATFGVEFEPIGAIRYVLGIKSWY